MKLVPEKSINTFENGRFQTSLNGRYFRTVWCNIEKKKKIQTHRVFREILSYFNFYNRRLFFFFFFFTPKTEIERVLFKQSASVCRVVLKVNGSRGSRVPAICLFRYYTRSNNAP